jgi:hypothetical protein
MSVTKTPPSGSIGTIAGRLVEGRHEQGWTYELRDSDREYVSDSDYTRFEGVTLPADELAEATRIATAMAIGDYSDVEALYDEEA